MEALASKFDKSRWIITPDEDSIRQFRGKWDVRTSALFLSRISKENWDRSRDIKQDITRRFLALTFPDHFEESHTSTYVPDTVASLIAPEIVPRLSSEDKEALNEFLPDYIASEASASVGRLKAAAQIRTLEALADNLEAEIQRSHPESWWQVYVKANILLLQQGYIRSVDKVNVAVGNTKFPDFFLVTHDSFIDILEIKKPDTMLLRHDTSRDNYYWDPEMAKAISQTENYLEQVMNKAADIQVYLRDSEQIDIRAIRPRGIILAGDTRQFGEPKQRADFRLSSQGIKNVTIVTYDELLARLRNYLSVLKRYGKVTPAQ